MTNTINGYSMTDRSMVVLVNFKPYTIASDNPKFVTAMNAAFAGDGDAFLETVAPKTTSSTGQGSPVDLNSVAGFEYRDGAVYYYGERMHSVLATKIERMAASGYDVTSFINFYRKLMNNPSKRSVEQLYSFLETGHFPITPSGNLLAYKAVDSNYKDYHSRSFDNSVGQSHSVPRNMVDDNPNNHCSKGFHFANIEYAKGFLTSSGHLMVVEIDPADVVSIPNDHGFSKARCCAYTVVGEVPVYDSNEETDVLNKSEVVSNTEFDRILVDSGVSEADVVSVIETLCFEEYSYFDLIRDIGSAKIVNACIDGGIIEADDDGHFFVTDFGQDFYDRV